jgi:hypothetical protein
MHPIVRSTLPALGLLLAASAAQAQHTVYGVTGGSGPQQLVRFSSNAPTAVTVVGNTGVNLTGIDFRPSNGVLYGYNGSLLYTIDLTTGAATQAFDVNNITGANAGFDFNPTVDRIRITDVSGTNLRVNPIDGTTITDGTIAGAISGDAYTNSLAGATTTTLYGIDANLGTLVSFVSPNAGTFNTVGSLGLGFAPAVNGFDIVTMGGVNFAFLAAGTTTGSSTANFYSVNLTTGSASLLGVVGNGNGRPGGLQGIAIQSTVPEPATVVLFGTGALGLVGFAARRRNRA